MPTTDNGEAQSVERLVADWQGQLAVAAEAGQGLDVFSAALASIKERVPAERALLERAKTEIWECAVRRLEDVYGLDVLASIYTSVMSDQPPGTNEELDQLALKEDERQSCTAEITRLKGLSRIDYDRERKLAADRLGVRVKTLDNVIANNGAGTGQGRAMVFRDPVPWHDPVDGAGLLDAIAANIRSHVVMPDHAAHAAALWVAHTFLLDCSGISPRLAITSPEKGCGKTTLLDVLSHLVNRPQIAANVTTAAIFRIVEMQKPTLLIDEADAFLPTNEELRGILNSGHRRGGTVVRTVGKDFEPREFSTYGACAIALIGKLPSTLEDRSVSIELQRRRADEPIKPFRFDRTDHLDQLARKAARWAADVAACVRGADPLIPAGLFNRVADNWRPLFAVADAAGGHWPQRAREAAHRAMDEDASIRVMLLADIFATFSEKSVDRLASEDLAKALAAHEERPWAEWGKTGRPITQSGIAKLLKPFKIMPGTVRLRGDTAKGYKREQFLDVWERYSVIQAVTPSQPANDGHFADPEAVTTPDDVTVEKSQKPNNDAECDGVTVAKPELAPEETSWTV